MPQLDPITSFTHRCAECSHSGQLVELDSDRWICVDLFTCLRNGIHRARLLEEMRRRQLAFDFEANAPGRLADDE